MRIVFVIHAYYPKHGAGAESVVRNMSRFFVGKGHQVHIMLTEGDPGYYEYEGAMVSRIDPNTYQDNFGSADVVFTHLGPAPWTIYKCREYDVPCVFISHNTHSYDAVNMYPRTAVVYNSHAMREIIGYKNPSIVVHPPVDYRLWPLCDKGKAITMVNLNSNKGGKLFLNIVKAMPERQFIGVVGMYDTQMTEKLKNLKIVPNQPDMRPIYAESRIVLMPSRYESWGMVATEAMASGIPVIYNPTFGLSENVGKAGIAVREVKGNSEIPDGYEALPGGGATAIKGGEAMGIDPVANLKNWMLAIKSLDDKEKYQHYVKAGLARAKELDPQKELEALEKFIFDGSTNR